MYQFEHTSKEQVKSGVVPPRMGFIQGILCWPGLLVQNVMVVFLLIEPGSSSWGPEVRRQACSVGYTRLYSGVFWLFMVALGGTILVA